jgi:hypothetical protein
MVVLLQPWRAAQESTLLLLLVGEQAPPAPPCFGASSLWAAGHLNRACRPLKGCWRFACLAMGEPACRAHSTTGVCKHLTGWCCM